MKLPRILKLGGSVITAKAQTSTLNRSLIGLLASEIMQWLAQDHNNQLILTCGGGSFGHPHAHKYMINEPTRHKLPIGFAITTTSVKQMACQVAEIFHEYKIPLLPISPSSIFLMADGRISQCLMDPILLALKNRLVPFLWGDAVFDSVHI